MMYPSAFLSPQSLPPQHFLSDDDLPSYDYCDNDDSLILTTELQPISPPAEYAEGSSNSPSADYHGNRWKPAIASHPKPSESNSISFFQTDKITINDQIRTRRRLMAPMQNTWRLLERATNHCRIYMHKLVAIRHTAMQWVTVAAGIVRINPAAQWTVIQVDHPVTTRIAVSRTLSSSCNLRSNLNTRANHRRKNWASTVIVATVAHRRNTVTIRIGMIASNAIRKTNAEPIVCWILPHPKCQKRSKTTTLTIADRCHTHQIDDHVQSEARKYSPSQMPSSRIQSKTMALKSMWVRRWELSGDRSACASNSIRVGIRHQANARLTMTSNRTTIANRFYVQKVILAIDIGIEM